MINIEQTKKFCKDDITKIENYEQAINDQTQTWHIHHRLERTINNEYAHSRIDLIRLDMYYNRPYYELIFLTQSEHVKLHHSKKIVSDYTKKQKLLIQYVERIITNMASLCLLKLNVKYLKPIKVGQYL